MDSIFNTMGTILEKFPTFKSDGLLQQIQETSDPNHTFTFTEAEDDDGWSIVTNGDIRKTLEGCWDDSVDNEEFF